METCHREEAEKIEEADVMSDDDESVPEEVMTREQAEIKSQLVLDDCEDWSTHLRDVGASHTPHAAQGKQTTHLLTHIGGVDISFIKGDKLNACAALVIVSFHDLEVVYEDISMVQLTAPYVPGFLAFRESYLLEEKLQQLKRNQPSIYPQVILADGNGILHPNGCGLACHLVVKLDTASVGVAKNLYHVDGLSRDLDYHKQVSKLQKAGDTFPLIGASGRILGMALRGCEASTKPVYVSVGHKISLKTAVSVVSSCCRHRLPEPVRQADIRSRQYLRERFAGYVTDEAREPAVTCHDDH